MPENHDHPVLKEYKIRKDNNELSPNLYHPTPASLRDECLIVYEERGKPNHDPVLRAFFGAINAGENYDVRISNFDIDRFRPLSYFLRGTSQSTNRTNVDLLNWLMGNNDSDPIPSSPPDSTSLPKPWYKALNANVWVALALIIMLLIGKLGFYIWEESIFSTEQPTKTEKCMYWTGYHYEPISCEVIKPGVNIVPLDRGKLKRMRKIPFFVKVTKRDVGKLWRAKVDGKLEYFTDSGMHPVETAKRLLPLSSYMVGKYEVEKNLITDILYWTYYVAFFSLLIFMVFQILWKKKIAKSEC
ncbi:MAG: hypothetical protein EOO20_04265 [Chryseobacterium sp.]|nr:MAG: hypothetical protein EOO20_04265 [Chryseobacterium sp.]